MKVEKLKRNFWLTSEIECMLNLIKEMQACQGTTATTHYTFVQIAAKMKKKGFPNKSPTQIRRKWFQMKSAYLCYKRGNVDRLLLIPERFRPVIAKFVDDEYQGDVGSNVVVPEEPELPIIKEPIVPVKAPPPVIIKATPPPQQGKYSRMLMHLRQTHKLISKDFRTMQESLLMYQHKSQTMRDANWMTFINRLGTVYENS